MALQLGKEEIEAVEKVITKENSNKGLKQGKASILPERRVAETRPFSYVYSLATSNGPETVAYSAQLKN